MTTFQETQPILPGINGEGNQKAVHHMAGLSLFNTVVFLVGEMAGSGVLALPKALADAGWAGVMLICGACFVAGFNGVHLGHCWNMLLERYPEYRDHVRYPYPAIAERAVGKWMRYVTTVSVAVTLFGVCTLFLLLVAENIHSLLSQIGVQLSFCWWMPIIAVVLIPFTWFGSPKDFWLVGIFAAGSSSIACLLLFISFLVQLPAGGDVTHANPTSFKPFFLAFGSILFAYGGASTFPTVQHDMKEPSKFQIAVALAFSALLCLYLPSAVTGYVVNGNDINANVIMSLPHGGLRIAIEILITLHLFFAFVIALNPFAQEFEAHLNIPNKFCIKRVLLRTVIVCAILFVGLSIPHFGGLLSLVGGSTVTFLTFVAPSVFYLRLCAQTGEWQKREVPLYQKVLHCIIIVIGILGGVASTYSAILEIVSPDTFVPPCYINSTAAGT